ncbi:DUF5344 family protein [Bacillus sp. FSL W7-1360]
MEIKIHVEEAIVILQAIGELAGSFEKEVIGSNEDLDMLLEETNAVEDIQEQAAMYLQALSQMEKQFQTMVQEYDTVDRALAGKINAQ